MFANKLQHGFLLLALAIPTTAAAQQTPESYELPEVGYQPTPPLPPELGFSYHHASTAAEGWLRGWSAVIHASGNYWLNCSQAAILYEYARSLETHNRRLKIEFHVGNRQRWKAELQRRIDAKRERNEARRVAKYESAYGLTSEELDRTNGAIRWPVVLQTTEFNDTRLDLEELFRGRAYSGESSNSGSVRVGRCIKSMRRTLQELIKEIPADEYVAAQKFLIGLQHDDEFVANDATTRSWHATLASD